MKQQLEHQPPIQSSRDSGGRNPDAELEAEFMGAKQSKGADMKHREALRRLEKEKKESQEVRIPVVLVGSHERLKLARFYINPSI